MKSNTEFLKKLKNELINQPTDGNASPRFWVIAQNEKIIAPDGYEDGQDLIYDDGEISIMYSASDVLNIINDMVDDSNGIYTQIYTEIKELINDDSTLEYIFDVITNLSYKYPKDSILSNFRMESYAVIHKIKENTMFITKEDAINHLKNNSHHYNSTAHTYAMTAFRSPAYSNLLSILSNPDTTITVSETKSQEDYYQHFVGMIQNQQDLNLLKKDYDFDSDAWTQSKIEAFIEFKENWDGKL